MDSVRRGRQVPRGGRPTLSRRQLLAALAAMAAAGLRGAPVLAGDARAPSGALGRQPAGTRWGVQLYTVRDLIAADPARTLERIAAIGYTELEIMQPTLPVVAPIARSLGLRIASAHLDARATTDEYRTFLDEASREGLTQVVVPFVVPGERPDSRAGVDALAARLSLMARDAAAAGLGFGYHNHAFEFGRDRDGARWLDLLMQGTAEAGMQLQLDVFWATVAGVDPVAVLRQYRGRITSMHLKDKARSAPTGVPENEVPRTAFVEVGAGAIDFPAVLSGAREAGVRHYFVEQDHAPGDPVDSLRKSHAYLRSISR
jgi:sugar phosphate isomerase/epimerase